ncbi:hypothetical protein KAW11_01375 [Candidatus Bathyarchaeota archaeon]|nr:hypothetical protein [Candidatus Bathyarchaeota archaeon]
MSNTPFLLIVGGIAATSWVLEKLVRRTPLFGKPLRWLVKIISGLGFIIGILLVATGIVVWAVQGWDSVTQTLLIVTGIALFLKPIKDIRWASLIGLAAGCLCLGYVMLLNPLPPSIFGIESKWIYAVIFLVPTLFTYLLFRFVEDLLTFIGTILSFRLVAITIGTLCVIQGILLLLDRSLFEIFQTL